MVEFYVSSHVIIGSSFTDSVPKTAANIVSPSEILVRLNFVSLSFILKFGETAIWSTTNLNPGQTSSY